MPTMPRTPIHHLIAVGFVAAGGLAATAGAASAPATATRLTVDAANTKSQIAFIVRRGQGDYSLSVVNADGSGQRLLTRNALG